MMYFSALCFFFLSIKRLPDSPQSFFGRVERTALCRWSGEQSSFGTWRRKWQSFTWSKRLRRASFRSALSRQTWYVRILSESHYLESAAPLLCLCIVFSRSILRHVFWITACQSVLLDIVWYAATVKRGKICICCKTRENVQLMSGAGKLVYHLQKDSGKYGLKVNETRLFGRSSGKFPGATEHLERSPVLPDEFFQTKILVPFLQSHAKIFSILSSAHKWTSVILAGNRYSRRHPTTVRPVSGPRGLFP